MAPVIAESRPTRTDRILHDIERQWMSDIVPYGVRLSLPDDGTPANYPVADYLAVHVRDNYDGDAGRASQMSKMRL